MTVRSRTVEVAAPPADLLGEGLLWDAEGQQLLWVDIERRCIRRSAADGALSAMQVDERPTALAPRRGGGLIVITERGVAETDGFGASVDMRVPIESARPDVRLNDAKCSPDGRLFLGTMHEGGAADQAALYRVDPDYSLTRVLDGVTLSNGLGWAPSGDVMYFIDTMSGGVDAFDYDAQTGEVRNRRRLVSVPADEGIPDGMTVDAGGCLWVALWGGGRVNRYRPTGEFEGSIRLPASQTTNCCFGGRRLEELYVTSARTGLTTEQLRDEPLAGSLFRIEIGARGSEASRFGG